MQNMLKVLLTQAITETTTPEAKAKVQGLLNRIEKLESAGQTVDFNQSDLAELLSGTKDVLQIIESKVQQGEAKLQQSTDETVDPLGEFLKQLTGGNPTLNPIFKKFTESVVPKTTQQNTNQNPLDGLGSLVATVLQTVKDVVETAKEEIKTTENEKTSESPLNKEKDFDVMEEDVVLDGSNGIVDEETTTEDTPVEPTVDTPKVYTGKVGVKKKDTQSGWNVTFVNEQGVLETGLVIAKWVERVDVLLPNGKGGFKKKKVGYDRLVSVSETSFSNPKPAESGWDIYKTGVLSLFDSKVPVIFLGEQKGFERVLVLNSTGEKYPMSKEEVRKYLA